MQPAPQHTRRWSLAALAVPALVVFIVLAIFGNNRLVRVAEERMNARMVASDERQLADQIAAVKAGTVAEIRFYSTHDTDGQLSRLEPLAGLDSLVFEALDVSKSGLQYLTKQPNLKHLLIKGAPKMDDSAMDAVAAFPSLESLTLDYTRVGDKGVKTIFGVPTLRSLTLSYDGRGSLPCPMTDASLAHLCKCTHLRDIRLAGDWFSNEAVEGLGKRCRTVRSTLNDSRQGHDRRPCPQLPSRRAAGAASCVARRSCKRRLSKD